jgi:hypothetical protein
MLNRFLLLCALPTFAACDLVPYRRVAEDTTALKREGVSPPGARPRTSTVLEGITAHADPTIPAFVETNLPATDTVVSETVETVTTTVTSEDTAASYGHVAPTEAEMVGWLLGQRVRVPRSRREWIIEPGETAQFTVVQASPMPEGGMVAHVRFSVVGSDQRGLRIEGLLRYTYTEATEGSLAVPIDFTPLGAERIGNW